MIDNSEIMRSYNAGRGDAFKSQGADKIVLKTHGDVSCEVCRQSTLQWTASDAIIYEDLPPLHPYCGCVLIREDK